MNQVEAAAWDARRALSDALGDPVVAELASRYAARNGDSAAVLAVADHAASAGPDAPSVYRRAIDLATAAGEYVRAFAVARSDPARNGLWTITSSGQLASVAGQRARAIDDLTHALASSEAAADVRPWLAENLVAVDRIDETIAVMVRLPPGVADQLAVDVLDRAYLARRMATCASLTKWLNGPRQRGCIAAATTGDRARRAGDRQSRPGAASRRPRNDSRGLRRRARARPRRFPRS
ncbi:MAG: hypothetical protein R3B06_04480 [Kofleriaceae bacterium]